MPSCFELALDLLKPVKLSVHDYTCAFVLARDGLVACRQINDAQARMPQPDPLVLRDPLLLCIRPPVIQRARSPFQHDCRNWLTARKHSYDSTHCMIPLSKLTYCARQAAHIELVLLGTSNIGLVYGPCALISYNS